MNGSGEGEPFEGETGRDGPGHLVSSGRHDEFATPVLAEAQRIEAEASTGSILLRLTGSLAVHLHCPEFRHLLVLLGRRSYRDLDYVAYEHQMNAIRQMLEGLGYQMDPALLHAQEFGLKRLVYEHPDKGLKVDVFLDEMRMAHTVDFRGRLELDAPTVPLVDLLLSKLQIHEITENDVKDIIVLLAEHEVGQGNEETIDLPYLLGLMAKDWGFHKTAGKNLDLVRETLPRYGIIPEEVASVAAERSRLILDRMASHPKTLQWKLRSKVGTRIRWYEDVEDVER